MKKNTQKTKENRFRGFTKEERRLIKAGMEYEVINLLYETFPIDARSSQEVIEAYEKYVGSPVAVCKKLIEEINQC